MQKKKSPYVAYTEEEVKRLECKYFVLQFGGDFVMEDKFYIFTQKEVTKLYNKTLKGLISIVTDGSEKDKIFALNLIGGMVVRPVRLH